MTTEEVRVKLADFEQKTQRAIAIRDQARQQAEQADIGVHQLQGACAVLRELLQADTQANPHMPATMERGNGATIEPPAE